MRPAGIAGAAGNQDGPGEFRARLTLWWPMLQERWTITIFSSVIFLEGMPNADRLRLGHAVTYPRLREYVSRVLGIVSQLATQVLHH